MSTDDTTDTGTLPAPLPPSLAIEESQDEPRIRMGSSGPSHRGSREVSINGLNGKESDQLEGFIHGHFWVAVNEEGRLRAIPTYKELPGPVDDEMLQPFWRPAQRGVEAQLELFELLPKQQIYSASIIIQSLCGYNYSPSNYTFEATNLQRWGFECLRSRRGDDGCFHEVWMLPYLLAAKGELKEVTGKIKPKKGSGYDNELEKRRLDAAVSFLCRNSSFGTLDVTIQRAAMCIPD